MLGFITKIFFLLGDLFQWTFGIFRIPMLGEIAVSILSIVGIGMLAWWSAKLIAFGNEDKIMD